MAGFTTKIFPSECQHLPSKALISEIACVYVYTHLLKSDFLSLDFLLCKPIARRERYKSSLTTGGALVHFL